MADNARFHNKLHRKNHHTLPTPGYPDSGTDPIASHEEPFQGDFIVNASISAHNNLYVDNNATILGNLSVYGDFTYFETVVSVTSALSVVNSGTGPALTVIQNGPQPIATFIDGDAGPLSGRYALMINDRGQSVFGWGNVGPVHNLSAFQLGIVDNRNQPLLVEEYNAGGNGAAFRGLRSRGDITSPVGVSANDTLVSLRGWGMLDGGQRPATQAAAGIDVFAAEKYTQSTQGSYITFSTTPTGSNSNSLTERVRIAHTGNVGIGITVPQQTLTVSGTVSAAGGLSARNGYFYQTVGIATPNQADNQQTLNVTGTVSASDGLSARNAYFVRRAAVGIISQHEENMATLTVRGSVSASEGLSAYSGNYWGYLSAAQLRAYYTDSNHVTANYIFGYENESIFTSGNNLSGNGDGTLTINYTNGLFVSSAPVHFPLALSRTTGLIFGRDNIVNLYRQPAGVLRTDATFATPALSAFTVYALSGSFADSLSGGDLRVDMLTAVTPNYSRLTTQGAISDNRTVSGIATDDRAHYIGGRLGINVYPLSTYGLHIRGSNVRVDGVDYSETQIPGSLLSGAFDTDAQSLFDLRSASPRANYNLSIASSGVGHFMKFFGGREGDDKPFINVRFNQPLRIGTYSSYFDGPSFRENMRIGRNGNVGIHTNHPYVFGQYDLESSIELAVNGAISAVGGVSARDAVFFGNNNGNLSNVTLTVSGGILSAVDFIHGEFGLFRGAGSVNTNVLTVSGGISASWGLSANNGNFIDRVKIGTAALQSASATAQLTVGGSISASTGLSARNAMFFGWGSWNSVAATVSGALSAQQIFVGSLSSSGPLFGTTLTLAGIGSDSTSTLFVSGGISSSWGLSAGNAYIHRFLEVGGVPVQDPQVEVTVRGSISATASLSARDAVFFGTGSRDTTTVTVSGTLSAQNVRTGSLTASGPVFTGQLTANTIFGTNSAFINGTLSAAWISLSAVAASTATLINPATATGEFLLLNINGTSRAVRLWEYTS